MMKALPPSLISTQSGVSSAESDAPAGSPELQPPEKNTLRRRLIGNATGCASNYSGGRCNRVRHGRRPPGAGMRWERGGALASLVGVNRGRGVDGK